MRVISNVYSAAYVEELAAFVELILGERPNPCTPYDALAASLVADAAQLSLRDGGAVVVPDLRRVLDGVAEPPAAVELLAEPVARDGARG